MADNIDVTPGSGKTVRADEVGSTILQVVKIGLGADGAEDLLLDSGQQTSASSLPVVIASDQSVITTIGSMSLVQVVFSLDNSGSYAGGDVLADTQEIAGAIRANGGTGYWQSIYLNDKDDQGQPMDIYLLQDNTSLGTENSPPSISDVGGDKILGFQSLAAADYKDLGAFKVAGLRNIGLPVKSASDSTSLYIGLVTQGTPTHSASGITAWIGFDRY